MNLAPPSVHFEVPRGCQEPRCCVVADRLIGFSPTNYRTGSGEAFLLGPRIYRLRTRPIRADSRGLVDQSKSVVKFSPPRPALPRRTSCADRIPLIKGDSLVGCPIQFQNFAQWDSTKKWQMACTSCLQTIEFKAEMARPAGFEPTTPWFVAKFSICDKRF